MSHGDRLVSTVSVTMAIAVGWGVSSLMDVLVVAGSMFVQVVVVSIMILVNVDLGNSWTVVTVAAVTSMSSSNESITESIATVSASGNSHNSGGEEKGQNELVHF